jgi:hypothetical protein
MGAQGWQPDPFGRHEDRWFSEGKPTRLVRDQGVEYYDDPPLEHYEPQPTEFFAPGNGSHDEPQGTGSAQDPGNFVPGMAQYDDPPKPGRAAFVAIALASVVVIAVVGGAVAVKAWPHNQNTVSLHLAEPSKQHTASLRPATLPPSTPAPQNTAGFHPTAQSPAGDAEQVATAFLRAWSSGAIGQAAALTDDPAAAQAALTAYGQDLYLRKLTGFVASSAPASTPGGTTTELVSFNLGATVALSAAPSAQSGMWSYQSSLIAYQVPNGPGWLIRWAPSVLAPNLTNGQRLTVVLVPSPSVSVTDNAGSLLSTYNDPGLSNIGTRLVGHAPTTAGTPGLSVEIVDSTGQAIPATQATVTPPKPSQLATTITPQAEKAAQSAVAGATGSAIVVLQPSTGNILAIANNAQFNDYALTAAVAPGSTMKIITSTALINGGLTSENSPVECPSTLTVQGITYSNDQNESEPPDTPFSTDFAVSCNNAFSRWWPQLSGQLASTAMTYYGLNQPWNIGLPGTPAAYFNAPADAAGSELAQEAFGEGALTASPLAMASVAATVDSGQFHQPVLIPGTPTVSASPLPASTDQQLKDMMRDVVTEGTADGIGFGPDIYAKTGTADVQGQVKANSWMVAFDPTQDVAIAALVIDAGSGAQAAGSEVKTFFDSY